LIGEKKSSSVCGRFPIRTAAQTGFTPSTNTNELGSPPNTKDIGRVFMISKKVKEYGIDILTAGAGR
jgi:hypothetical protein